MRGLLSLIALVALVAAGCGGNDPLSQPKRQVNPEAFGVSPNAPSDAPPPPAPVAASPATAPSSETASAPPPPPPPPASASQPAPAPTAAPAAPLPAGETVKAEPGVGKKGRGYEPGFITTPVATYFRIKERIPFEIEIPKAMQLFKATNDRAPQSHEEFMEKIVKENSIRLPQLPEGERYLYDPKSEQLMVQRPAPPQ